MKSPLNRGGLRFYLVLLALLAGTWANTTTQRTILAGLPLLVLGVCLHTWAKGCLRQNQFIATTGPYRFVRHPFYLANALIDAGLVVMSGSLLLAAVLPLWWLAIYIPVIGGEERYLADKFPDTYPEFRRRVPCLIPWRWPQPNTGGGFRWDNPNIAGGEELPRAVRILAYPLLFFVVMELRNGGPDWLRTSLGMTAIAGLVSLYAFAWSLERHQRRQRLVLPRLLQHPLFRAAAAAAILAAVYCAPGPRAVPRDFAPVSGGLLLMLSAPIYSPQRPVRVLLAELLALLGAIAASGLVWLAPLSAILYMAWIFDRGRSIRTATYSSRSARCYSTYWPYLYPLIVAASAALIGTKIAGYAFPGMT